MNDTCPYSHTLPVRASRFKHSIYLVSGRLEYGQILLVSLAGKICTSLLHLTSPSMRNEELDRRVSNFLTLFWLARAHYFFFCFVGFRIIPFDLSNGDYRYDTLIKEMDNAIDRACSSHPSKPVFLMGHGMVRKNGDGLLPDKSLARV